MNRFVVISGCSGGGKSTLLRELGDRGFATIDEPGRRIVAEETRRGGKALPWVDASAFIRRAIARSVADLQSAANVEGWVFFDRGLIDAAAGLERLTGEPVSVTLGQTPRLHRQVFFTPPWSEIYATDSERRHGLDDAILEYEHLLEVYSSLGYDVAVLPRTSVSERADLVLHTLAA